MIRSDLRTEVRSLLKEATAVFWSDALLNRYLDDAILAYTGRLGLNTREQSTNAVLNQEDYLLPSNFIPPVEYAIVPKPTYYTKLDGKPLSFAPVSTYQLIKGYGTGSSVGTTPRFFTYFNGAAGGTGWLWNVKLFPAPAANGTNNIIIGYEAQAAKMASDAAVPELLEEDHQALAWYAAAQAFLLREQTEQAAVYTALFDRRIAERLPREVVSAPAE